jgi:hypothetical protein
MWRCSVADREERGVRRRGPDLLTLVMGLLTLGVATSAFVGEMPTLAGLDARWLLAAGAAAIGVLLLVGSLRGRGRRTKAP